MKRKSPPEYVPIPVWRNTGTGLPWIEIKIGDRMVSIFHDYPGHWYALGSDGQVHSGRSFQGIKERLVKIAIEQERILPEIDPL